MANLAYREVYTMNATETRKLLIKAYHETKSISKTARMWKTSRNVIRKWVPPPGWALWAGSWGGAWAGGASRPKGNRDLRTSPADPFVLPAEPLLKQNKLSFKHAKLPAMEEIGSPSTWRKGAFTSPRAPSATSFAAMA